MAVTVKMVAMDSRTARLLIFNFLSVNLASSSCRPDSGSSSGDSSIAWDRNITPPLPLLDRALASPGLEKDIDGQVYTLVGECEDTNYRIQTVSETVSRQFCPVYFDKYKSDKSSL